MIPVLQAALAAGVILRAEGEQLSVRSPAPLDPALRARLAAVKPEILAFLGAGRRIGPASAAQRAIWLADAAGRGYAVTAATRLDGAAGQPDPLTPAALGAALGALASRHPALRTRLLLVGEEPAQLVEPDATLPLETADAADLEAALAHAAAWAAMPLDPTAVPPGRALLLRLGSAGRVPAARMPTDWVFVISLHHAFCDAASLDVLAGDLALLLRQPRDGRHRMPLAPPGPDMLDHAAAERVAPAPAASLTWWEDTLRDVPPLVLGAEPLRPASGAGRLVAALPREAWHALTASGREIGATSFATLLGVLGTVLARHAADGRLLLHTPATVRGQGFERTVGCFAGLQPLVLDLRDEPALSEAIRRAAGATTEMLAHADVALGAIAERAPAAARPCLLFTHRRGTATIGEALSLPPGAPKADLVLEGAEGPGGLTLNLEWDRSVIDDGIAATLLEELTTLCEAAASHCPAALPARQAALHAALAPTWPAAGSATIHGMFAIQAAAAPDRVAVRADGTSLTYGALDTWSNAIAAALGSAQGEVLGIALPRGTAMIAAWLGCLKAGAAYLPLDPAWPKSRQNAVLAAADAHRVLDAAALPSPETRVIFRPPAVHPLALACVFATSGSTGQPKAVGVPHRAIPRLTLDRVFSRIGPGDVVAQAGSVAFDATSWEVWGALLNGATVAVLDADVVLDADALAAALAAQNVTHIFLTKTLFDAVAAARPDAFAGLRALCVGGEALEPRACAGIRQPAGFLPAGFLNVYGPTETATFAACHAVSEDVGGLRRVPIGLPAHGTTLRVLDRRLRPAAVGAPGELFIGGDALGRGYLGQPGLTAERFLPDPYGPPGSRLYRTGDRARLLPDGTVDMLGRLDQQVKIRGFRVEPGEVQATLRALPGVTGAHVMAQRGADGTMTLLAWVVGIEAAAALDGLRAALPAPMVPTRIWRVARLPVTTTGKIDSAGLPRDNLSETAIEPPQGPTEQAVAALAQDVLGLSELGRHDNFFALGAHSLSAMRLLSRLRTHFGTDLPLRAVFQAPTVASLATRLPDRPTFAPALAGGAPPTLLPAQDRVWLLTRLGSGAAWHIPIAVRLRGPLDAAALRRAFDALLARHAALRTGIVEQPDGRPIAAEQPPGPAPFALHDAAPDLMAAITAEAARPFDLDTGPFLRATLWRTGPDEHVLLLVLHHAAADGWSVGVLLREAAALYAGQTLPPVRLTVFDWARFLRDQDVSGDTAFWRERLAGAASPDLRLRGRGGPGLVRQRLRPDLAAAARTLRTTPFILGLTAWAAVLARRANAPDLLLGTVLAGRDHPEAEGLVGMLVQTLPLRLDLRDNPTGESLVARAMTALEAAHAHRAVPFDSIVEAAGQAGAGADALLRHLVVLQNQPWPSGGLPGLMAEEVPLPSPAAKTDTTLALDADLSEAALEYHTDRMGEADAGALLAAFARTVAALADAPATRLAALPAVETPSSLIGPLPGLVPPLLHWGPPDQPALVASDAMLSGQELRERVEQVAGRLAARGIGPECLVGLCAGRSAAQVVALLAVLRAGGAWLPLEPDQPAARLREILAAARPALVLADAAGAAALAAAAPGVRPLPLDGGDVPAASPDRAEPHLLGMAYALFTSGSTGTPKAVVVPREALIRHMAWMDRALPLRPDDRLLLKTPMGFDASVWEYLAAFRHGATLHVAPEGAQRDAAALLAAVAEARATVLQLVPSVLVALMREPGFEAACGSLRRLCLGGEAVPRALAEAVARRLPGCRLVNLYGPAEATIQAVVQDGLPADFGETMPIGRPIEGVRAWLSDAWGAAVEPGSAGRLWLAGPALARGYLGHPDLTADRFRPDPDGPPGSRALDTGDVCRLRPEDGTLEWLGRADRQAKLHGVRVEPAEIEAALLRQPGVVEAAAGAVEGPAGPVLAAWAVMTASDNADAAALRAALVTYLPSALVPSRIVILPALPRLPNGKLDRRALRLPDEMAARPATNLLVETVAAIMAALLGMPGVAPDANFFALGGHSLLAAQLASRLRNATGKEIPLSALFTTPSPAGIARTLGSAPVAAPLPVLPHGVNLPLGSAQRRLWTAVRLSDRDSRWTMGGPMVLRGAVEPTAIEQALATIQARHEPLRTRFVEDDDGLPVQIIDPPRFRLEQDVAPDLEVALADARALMAQPFDLAAELPFRARLVQAPGAVSVLSLVVHHIAADGWSIGVLMQELVALLNAPGVTLPAVPRYAEAAAWMDAQDTDAAQAWWRAQLAGLPALRLPGDGPRPGPSRTDASAAALPLRLDAAAVTLARDCAATPFMALAAGFAAALFEATGQIDLALGTDVADRRHVATEGLIGFFANPVVLRLDLSGDPTTRELVARVRTAALGAFMHQHAPADRVLAGLPPIRAKLTWQPTPSVPQKLAGCTVEWPEAWPGAIPGDLLINLVRAGDTAVGAALYRTAALQESVVAALLARFAEILSAMAAAPDVPLSALVRQAAPPVADVSRMRRRVRL